jgi:hypothetical protein
MTAIRPWVKSAKHSVWGLVLGFCACQIIAGDYDFRVVVVNLGSREVTEVQVIDGSGKNDYGGGILVPSGYKANAGPMSSPPNDIFMVRWKDSQNQDRLQKFDLRRRLKRNFDGEIVFIHGEDEKFTVEVFDQQRGYEMPTEAHRRFD